MNNSPDWKKDKRRRLLGCSKWLSIFGGILVFGALAMVSMRSFIVEAFNDARHKSFMAPAGKMFAHNADHFYFAAVSDTGARTEPVEEIMNEIRKSNAKFVLYVGDSGECADSATGKIVVDGHGEFFQPVETQCERVGSG